MKKRSRQLKSNTARTAAPNDPERQTSSAASAEPNSKQRKPAIFCWLSLCSSMSNIYLLGREDTEGLRLLHQPRKLCFDQEVGGWDTTADPLVEEFARQQAQLGLELFVDEDDPVFDKVFTLQTSQGCLGHQEAASRQQEDTGRAGSDERWPGRKRGLHPHWQPHQK